MAELLSAERFVAELEKLNPGVKFWDDELDWRIHSSVPPTILNLPKPYRLQEIRQKRKGVEYCVYFITCKHETDSGLYNEFQVSYL